jgi:murein L,D-transpeptidase YafK
MSWNRSYSFSGHFIYFISISYKKDKYLSFEARLPLITYPFMKLKKRFRIIFFITIPVIFFLLIISILYFSQPELPLKNIESSREALSKAVRSEASFFAPKELALAGKFRDEMMKEWNTQNNKPVYKRDYKKVKKLAEESLAESEKAIRISGKGKKDLDKNLQEKLALTAGFLEDYEQKYDHLPVPASIKKEYIKAKLLFMEARSALNRKDKQSAYKKAKISFELAKKVQTDAESFLGDYFKMHSQWEKWVKETINWSAKNRDYAIVVDKLAHTCTLYKNGSPQKKFPIEMGINWIGDKVQKGDKTTPEGKYHITKKLEKGQTIYYKALLINYPNAEDKERFSREIKNGNLPPKTHIGNLIEIHGGGGKGIHWTDGCVALLNSEMDVLYRYAKIGTPVTIVGSTRPLSKIFE